MRNIYKILFIMFMIQASELNAVELIQPAEIKELIAKISAEYNHFDIELLNAISFVESTWRINARSSAGAYGLFQITSIAQKEVLRVNGNKYNRFNTEDNIRIAIEYIMILTDHYKIDSLENVLRFYNGGRKYLAIPSTKKYTDKIFNVYKILVKIASEIEVEAINLTKMVDNIIANNNVPKGGDATDNINDRFGGIIQGLKEGSQQFSLILFLWIFIKPTLITYIISYKYSNTDTNKDKYMDIVINSIHILI